MSRYSDRIWSEIENGTAKKNPNFNKEFKDRWARKTFGVKSKAKKNK